MIDEPHALHRSLTRRRAIGLGLAGGAFVALTAAGAGCGDDDDDSGDAGAAVGGLQVTVVTSELTPGPNRFVFALFDDKNRPVLGEPARAGFFSLANGANPRLVGEATAQYHEIRFEEESHAKGEAQHAEALGIYVVRQTFDVAGPWGLQVATADGRRTETGVAFNVAERASTTALGAAVPRTISPTAADRRDASELCTRKPECGLHTMTIAEAVGKAKPAVISFSTPAYCASRVCGPMLEVVLDSRNRHKNAANYVHVEIYRDGQSRQRLDAVGEWNLPTEPWLFVVDGRGNLVAKFEGIMAAAELEAALQQAMTA